MRDARRLPVGSGIENVSECIRCVIQALASRKLATKSVSLTEAMVNLDVPLVVAVGIGSCAADLAKVTVAHSSTRNPRPESSCGGIPQAFVVKKEERLVFLDGTADCAAKQVITTGCQLATTRITEPVVGGQHVVTQEFVGAPVEGVGARAGDQVDNSCPAEPDFGAEVGLLNLKLLHGIH